MSTGFVIAIVVIAAVAFGAIVVLTTARSTEVRGAGALSRETRSHDRKTTISTASATGREVEAAASTTTLVKALPAEIAPFIAPDEEAIGVSRRMFFNRTAITLMAASLGAFGASAVAFLWKGADGGFGSKISVGKVEDVVQSIRSNKGFLYLSEARAWVTEYPKGSLGKAQSVYANQAPVYAGMESGIVALYQKCPHLGCRVPECSTSQWFECPCHGSQFNRVGEKKGGPAPRGMDRFGVSTAGGVLTIDTAAVFAGPSIGVNTTGQEAEGPHCVGGGH
jgi:cytochrome b6-f complex iron-sulfur subunit